MNGPVPLARNVAAFSLPLRTSTGAAALFFSHQALLTIYQVLRVSGRIGNGSLVIKSTVWSSTFLTSFIGPILVFISEPSTLERSYEKTTSSAVNGVPS